MPRVLEWGMPRGDAPFHVTIAIPVFKDPVPETMLSLAGTARELEFHGIAFTIELLVGDCHVDDARNHMARNFLERDSDFFFFIDADLSWLPVDFIRVLQAPQPLAIGCYPLKGAERYPLVLDKSEDGPDEHGLRRAHGGPTGFMRIFRDVLQAVYDAEPGAFRARSDGPDRLPIKTIFERTLPEAEDGVLPNRRGGDMTFCWKWAKLGGQMHVVSDITFTHVGQNGWTGNLERFLKRESERRSEPEVLKAVRGRNPAYNDFEDLARVYGNERWAATPQFAERAYRMAMDLPRGSRILECGSGLTTIVLLAAAEKCGHTVRTLEHDLYWFLNTKGWLEKACLRTDGLLVYERVSSWYDGAEGELERPVDLLVIDGPPRHLACDRLYPLRKGRPGCVLIDDATPDVLAGLGELGGSWDPAMLGGRPACIGKMDGAIKAVA